MNNFKDAAKQYASLLTLPTELLKEACELDFEAGMNYCYKEITEPIIKQNSEYIEALRGEYNRAINDAIEHFKQNDANQFKFIITYLESLKK